MAPSPFRRRKAAKTVRNLAIAEAALALAKDRVGHSSRRSNGKLLLIGGAVAAVGAVALLKRDKVAGLLPSRAGEPEPAAPVPTPPQPSNYDAPGPVANTATPIPAPDPQGAPPPAINEAAEEAAAGAEARAIGGPAIEYAGTELGARAGEAERPLAEAGEGEAEGQEQAEAELADNATYRDAGASDDERQMEDAIEQAGQPQAGETPEPVAAPQTRPTAQTLEPSTAAASAGTGPGPTPDTSPAAAVPETAPATAPETGPAATPDTSPAAAVPETAPATAPETGRAAGPDTSSTGETREP